MHPTPAQTLLSHLVLMHHELIDAQIVAEEALTLVENYRMQGDVRSALAAHAAILKARRP